MGGKSADEILIFLYQHLNSIDVDDHLILYADNCFSQNKNRFLISFMHFLIETKMFSSVILKFLLKGHTHFAPDSCFGLISNKLKETNVYTENELSKIINKVKNSNCYTYDNVYDWKSFLDNTYSGINGHSKAAEIMVHQYNLGNVFYSTTLKYPVSDPSGNNYEYKINIKSNLMSGLKTIDVKPSSNFTSNQIDDIKCIKNSGIIPSEFLEYYNDFII